MKLKQNSLKQDDDLPSSSRRKTLEMPENTEVFGNVVADWLQNRVINLLSE